MISWYYVQGSERVGPVEVELLKTLFLKGELNSDSYVWRKGFQNWEHIKDVSELDFSQPVVTDVVKEVAKEIKNEPEETEKPIKSISSEIIFNFDWRNVRDKDELFFIKTGKDRKNKNNSKFFGPYSLNELREAIVEKRINNQTLLFAAGMRSWIEIDETPLNPVKLKMSTNFYMEEIPLFVVIDHEPLSIIALVEKAGVEKCTLLSAGPFNIGSEILCSIYSGITLKAKNLKLKVESFDPRAQKVNCDIIEINESAKKVMTNYAD